LLRYNTETRKQSLPNRIPDQPGRRKNSEVIWSRRRKSLLKQRQCLS